MNPLTQLSHRLPVLCGLVLALAMSLRGSPANAAEPPTQAQPPLTSQSDPSSLPAKALTPDEWDKFWQPRIEMARKTQTREIASYTLDEHNQFFPILLQPAKYTPQKTRIAVGPDLFIHENTQDHEMIFASSKSKAALVPYQGLPTFKLVDLDSGTIQPAFEFPKCDALLDIDFEGSRCATVNGTQVSIWSMSNPKKPELISEFTADRQFAIDAKARLRGKPNVRSGKFVNGNCFITCTSTANLDEFTNFDGLVCTEISSKACLWRYNLGLTHPVWAMSPDRRVLALLVLPQGPNANITLFEPVTFTPIIGISTPKGCDEMNFSVDGSMLVTSLDKTINFYHLATRQILSSQFPDLNTSHIATLPGNRVVIGDKVIVDAKTGQITEKLPVKNPPERIFGSPSGLLWSFRQIEIGKQKPSTFLVWSTPKTSQ